MNNKYQESLDRFKVVAQNDWLNNYQKCKDEEKTIHIGNYRMFEIDGEAIKTLQELVDKETPKKYKSKTDKDGRMIWVCPKCNETLIKFWSEVETVSHLPYCYMCGQELDWSEE